MFAAVFLIMLSLVCFHALAALFGALAESKLGCLLIVGALVVFALHLYGSAFGGLV